MKKNIVIFEDKNGNVELRADIEKDTLWATQAQIAKIFDCSSDNVSVHMKNIFDSRELKFRSTTEESSVVQIEGGRTVERSVTLYNLDAIIAVGYRVNSKKATKFRIWATRILREYLIKGFNLDKRQLALSADKLEDVKEAIAFMESESRGGPLKAKMTVRLTKNLLP